jgi:hypothetical protein
MSYRRAGRRTLNLLFGHRIGRKIMAFKGCLDTALAFYEGLEADNSKGWITSMSSSAT